MIRALSYCRMPGMSCPREMRPTPIAPTLMRLLGAYWPNTLAGTIAGKLATAAAPNPVFRNLRRDNFLLFVSRMLFSIRPQLGAPGLACETWDSILDALVLQRYEFRV